MQSLWWDSYKELLDELIEFEEVEAGKNVEETGLERQEMEEKLDQCQHWLVDLLQAFEVPSEATGAALDAATLNLGSHKLEIDSELKSFSRQITKHLNLHEVQSYLLLSRYLKARDISLSVESSNLLQDVTIAYFVERQCLLKCLRLLILMESMSSTVKELCAKGLEESVRRNLEHALRYPVSKPLDPDYVNLWADQIALEQTLLLDILFLLYSYSLSVCRCDVWKELFGMFQDRVFENKNLTHIAEDTITQVRSQALFVLIEGLHLGSLMESVYTNKPFSQACTPEELQELDAMICRLDSSTTAEYAPLLIAWASFICLFSTLSDHTMILDIEHSGYAQQAYKSGAYTFLADILRSERFEYSDVSHDYKAAAQTLTSACLAAYTLNQTDKTLQDQLVDVLSEAFKEQEALCVAFWVRECAQDWPVRTFVTSLVAQFPYQIQPLSRLLSSLCTGVWPAECVYDFLFRPISITCMYRPTDEENMGSTVVLSTPIQIPKCSGLYIPAGATGQILRHVNDGVLVRWECEHNGLIVLLTCMSQWPGDNVEDVISIVTLLNKLLTSNKRLSEGLLNVDTSSAAEGAREDGRMDQRLRFDVLSSICFVIKSLLVTSLQPNAIAESISLLQKFVDSCPQDVMRAFEKTGLFCSSEGEANLSRLEQAFTRHFTTVSSIIDVASSLIKRGVQEQPLSAFVLFIIDNVLANHVNWKFAKRHERWYLFDKIYEMILLVLKRTRWHGNYLRKLVLDSALKNTIFHGVLFHVLSLNATQVEELFFNRLFRAHELDALLDAIYSALELVDTLLRECTTTDFSNVSIFCRALFYSSTGAASPIGIITSYLHFQRCKKIQTISLHVLGKICEAGQKARPQALNVASFISGVESRKQLRTFFTGAITHKHAYRRHQHFDAVLSFLTSATSWQPGMVDLLFSPWDSNGTNTPDKSEVLTAVWDLFTTPGAFSERDLEVKTQILALLVSIWQGGTENFSAIQVLRTQKSFWEVLSSQVLQLEAHIGTGQTPEQAVKDKLCYRCQAAIYQVMAYDMFIQFNSADPKLREGGCSLKWITPKQSRDVLKSCITYKPVDDAVLKMKAGARTFSIGLLVKALKGHTRGMDASFVRHLLHVSSQMFEHPAFKELLNHYRLQGYRDPEQLLNDIYHNLVLEMAGREISNRYFQEFIYILAENKVDTVVLPCSEEYVEDASLEGPYDVKALEGALGLNFWDDQTVMAVTNAEQALSRLNELNHLINVRNAQLSAVNAFTDYLKVGTGDNSENSSFWSFSTLSPLVEDVCRELKCVLASKEKLNEYYARYLASLSKLLVALVWQFIADPGLGSRDEERVQLRATFLEAIEASFGCMKLLQDKPEESESLKSLFESVLTALEVTTSRQIPVTDIATCSLGHLQMLCNMVGDRKHTCYALATINTLIRFYFDSSTTWIPVLQTHFPTRSLVSTVALVNDEDVQICGVVMSFCLYLSRFKVGAEMLFGAGFLQYVSMVNHELREEFGEGPFSMSKAKSSRQLLWALGVAILTSFLRALGHNNAYQRPVMDNVFSYFRAERHKLLRALAAPSIRNTSDGRKMVRYQRAQTSSAFLQEAQYVAALLCEVVRHPLSVAGYLLSDELFDFREAVLLLLSYIAREGLVRSSREESMTCPPVQKQELIAHAKSSTMGSSSAWFLLSARGASVNKTTSKELAGTPSASAYSESIAVRVYKLVNLLLRFLIIQVRQALQDAEECRSIRVQGFPELPAPDILHALQDQVMLVTTEMANSKTVAPEATETCCMLLSTLEKCLYLESCISRMCGLAPVSMRVDDFSRELKTLAQATKGDESLSFAMESVTEIAGLVYPNSN